MKKVSFLLLLLFAILRAESQTTSSFNFSRSPQTVAGWTNLYGDPAASTTPLTATASSGIAISSIGSSNWAGYNGAGSSDAGGAAGGAFFPAAVMSNMWFQYSTFYGRYIAGTPQLEISGLRIDSVYTLKMTGSFTTNVPATFNLNPMRYTVSGASVYGYIDVNGNFNTSDGAVFHNIAPNASGKIQVYLSTVNGSNVAGISGLQIMAEHSAAPSPVVSIVQPSNNTLTLENSNVLISASAAETGGSIAKVEFYADSTKIGEDTVTPYSFTWNNALKGTHVLKARAIDGLGNASTATVNISVQPLTAFWSTAGNAVGNADSNFLGAIDSSRLAFRTKNVEKMSLSPAGVLRLNQYKNDALGNSILTTDTLGNLKLRGMTFGNGLTLSRDSVFLGGNINFGRYPGNSIYFNFLNPADTVSSAVWEYTPSIGMRTVVNQMHGGNDGLNTNFYLAPTGITLLNQSSSLASGTLKGGGAYMHLYGNNVSSGNIIEQAVYDVTGTSGYIISPQSIIWNTKKIQFANFYNNAAGDSVLTTDASGTLKLKALSSFGSAGNWKISGATTYDSVDNIGIGTSNTQGYKLAVNGSILSKKVKVTQTGWPDFVFKKEYALPSLAGVEQYISIYHHLPGILSAGEVENKGLDLGDNQAALLQKIEEITLYLIGQEKEINELKQENKKLKDQNAGLETQKAAIERQQQEIDQLKEMMNKMRTGS